MRPAVFLDRDGVINQNHHDYVKSWAEFAFLPNVFTPLQRLAHSQFAIIIISNQSAIGRGLTSVATVEDINRRMAAEIARHGGRIDSLYYCPHRPDENCACRKPRPALLQRAAAQLDLDLVRSFLIGDAVSDVEAALNAGCRPILVLTGRGREQLSLLPPAVRARCHISPDLAAAVDYILQINLTTDAKPIEG